MAKDSKPSIIIGLGNPGKEYKNTYHNAGQMAVLYLAEKFGVHGKQWKSAPLFDYAKTGDFILIITKTFMNESGAAVASALKFFNVKKEDIIVAHDESDLNLGNLKISFGSGSAGHHGVESVQKALKTKNFWRGRVGIRPEREAKRLRASDFVLKKIKKTDLEKLHLAFAGFMEK